MPKKEVCLQLKLFAVEETVLLGRGDTSWRLYKLLKELYNRKKVFLRNGIVFWKDSGKGVEVEHLL